MKVAVRYYTKSGNTEKIARAIAEEVNVPAENVSVALDENVDLLFLGASYYAFDMDPEVKKFLTENKDKISKVALFGTSAMMKSMKKPMNKVISDLGITLTEEEFHCRGKFGVMHKDRPNENDLAEAKKFSKELLG